jgi:hypothetical protein
MPRCAICWEKYDGPRRKHRTHAPGWETKASAPGWTSFFVREISSVAAGVSKHEKRAGKTRT